MQTSGFYINYEYIRKNFLNYSAITVTFLLSLVLLFAGTSKIFDPSPLINSLSSTFNFLPEILIILMVTILPIMELGLGMFLIFSLFNAKIKQKRRVLFLITTFLFSLFLVFSIYGYVIGKKNDCGCFGNAISSRIGLSMVLRNFILTIVTFLLFIFNRQ